jgi:hypothetical protein
MQNIHEPFFFLTKRTGEAKGLIPPQASLSLVVQYHLSEVVSIDMDEINRWIPR